MKHDNVFKIEETSRREKYPEDIHRERNIRPSKLEVLSSRYLKGICLVLFCIAVILECVNVALVSKCEKQNETEQALGRFLSALTQHKSFLSRLVFNHRLARFPQDTNNTSTDSLCIERREFTLQISDKRVNICTYEGEVRVDIRQFINNKPTIKGIYFTPREFLGVTDILPHVRSEILRQMELLRLESTRG